MAAVTRKACQNGTSGSGLAHTQIWSVQNAHRVAFPIFYSMPGGDTLISYPFNSALSTISSAPYDCTEGSFSKTMSASGEGEGKKDMLMPSEDFNKINEVY